MKTYAALGRPELTSQTIPHEARLQIILDFCRKPEDKKPGQQPKPAVVPVPGAPLTPSLAMGLKYNVYLDSSKIFGCKNCKTHLANYDDVISRVGPPPALFYTGRRLTSPHRTSVANMVEHTSSLLSSTPNPPNLWNET